MPVRGPIYIHHKVFPARHRSGLLICARAVALALALRRCPVSGPSRLSASEASHALGDSVLGALVVVKERLPRTRDDAIVRVSVHIFLAARAPRQRRLEALRAQRYGLVPRNSYNHRRKVVQQDNYAAQKEI